MSLLIINHRDLYHPQAGGAEEVIYQVAKRLSNVTWLAERVKGRKDEELVDGIKILRRGNKLTLHFIAPFEAKRYNIVIDSIAHAVPFFSYIVNKHAIALVHHVHQDVLKFELNPFMANIIRLAERRIRNYKYIISVSNTTKRDLIEKIGVEGNRIKVIYNGVDHNKFKPGKKSEEPIVLWIGRLMKYKNPFDIIEIKRRVRNKVRFIVAGGGELQEDFLRVSKKEGIEYLGRIPEAEKIKWYQSAWLLISTSFIEGWGMTIVEANACGTPAVAYDTGSLPEIIRNGYNGFVVKYKNFDGMADKIDYITSDENIMKDFSINSFNESKKYDWDITAKEYQRFINEVVSSN
ncbi:glycosyltransferase [Acidianus sulfidivorans JP7]|uniref:Glycosyltransferase family 1 protein n=1 Tax=Acidianus sulfidivorans JP7 TaxID=619593 RepID=A0A2U9IN82_9CREN|nr:glycosyltransferase family 4 protein [Acidianus sulfidivorans]AWR97471.1 glycosyltransferase [Acidianus sulfidivorans JP7]